MGGGFCTFFKIKTLIFFKFFVGVGFGFGIFFAGGAGLVFWDFLLVCACFVWVWGFAGVFNQ